MSVFIIAEAGVNHNGSLALAKKLCDKAKEAGVDAVKFQTWQTDKIVTRFASKASYQSENTGNDETQYDMLKALELSYEDFSELQNYCDKLGIIFLSTPDEEWSLKFLMDDLHLPLIKVGSGEVTNIPYLRKIASYKKPVILSTGMSTLAQVCTAYDTLLEFGCPEVTILHCTTNYPCPYNEVNLNAMLTIKEALKCKVGYSDHTMGIDIPIAAVALGAQVIEKHFTLDKNMDGPDHKASLDPKELKQMVQAIRRVEMGLGDGIKQPNASEKVISKVVLKRIVAKTNICAGQRFTDNNITVKRSDDGISAELWDYIIGKEAKCEYVVDQPINF